VRCGATTHTAQLDLRREPRDTAEQATRREPQLGAEPRREDEDEKREQQLRFTSQLKRNYSGSCGPGIHQSCDKIVLKLAHCALLWLLLIRVLLPHFFLGQSPPNLSPLKISVRSGHERNVYTRSGTSCRHHRSSARRFQRALEHQDHRQGRAGAHPAFLFFCSGRVGGRRLKIHAGPGGWASS